MEKEKRTLNNAQRKALAQVVEETYTRLIQEAKDKENLRIDEVTEQVKAELGVDKIDNQIKFLKEEMDSLEEKKRKLGFGYYEVTTGSKAQSLIDTRAHQESAALEKERARKLAGLWTAQTIDEAKVLLKGIVK